MKPMSKKGILIVVSGPSGGGKGIAPVQISPQLRGAVDLPKGIGAGFQGG